MDAANPTLDDADIFGGLDLTTGNYGESPEEKAVKQALDEIAQKNPLTGSRIALARMCISLAQNISKGNAKGRAVANEVATLGTLMAQLDPAIPDADDSDLPPELRKIADALATAPRPGGPTASDAA
ncbi:hypothetical protein GCM10017714_33580 [Curtobacterium pusillum]|uniref:Terminase small subunit n=1 Tax=Curtobacterium pusillum TaxID=69373 RepID=A0ABX2M5V5_9MICO|nr:hypothetical protein [Curtobacterium pusillum]NUU12718.1 hypothetical protein [Curtobacterium pusillum]GLK31608.1 hypothetical protein GCM10017610_18930 [Curtobacterium pusillum]